MQQHNNSHNQQQQQQAASGTPHYQQYQQPQYYSQQQQSSFPGSLNNSSTNYPAGMNPPVGVNGGLQALGSGNLQQYYANNNSGGGGGVLDDGEKRGSLESLRSQGGYITNGSFSPMGESFSSSNAASVFGGDHIRQTASGGGGGMSGSRGGAVGMNALRTSHITSSGNSTAMHSPIVFSNLQPVGFHGNPSGVSSNRIFLEKPAIATLCHILETRWKMPSSSSSGGAGEASQSSSSTTPANSNSDQQQSVVQRLPVPAGQLQATPERMDQPFSLFSFRSMFRVKGQQVEEDVPVEWSDYGCVYHCTFQAEINLKEYVERLVKYFKCAPQCYPVAIALLDRFVANTQVAVDSRNVLRLFLCALLAAAKSREEKYMTMSYYAHIGGITPFELRSLELHFLFSLRWELQVSESTYNNIAQSIALSSIVPRGIITMASASSSGGGGSGLNILSGASSPLAASFISTGSTPGQLRVGTPMATVCSPPSGRETPVRYLAGTPAQTGGNGGGVNTRILHQTRQLATVTAVNNNTTTQQQKQQAGASGGGPMPMNMFQPAANLVSGASSPGNAHLNFSSSGAGGGGGVPMGSLSGGGGSSGYASLGYMGLAGGQQQQHQQQQFNNNNTNYSSSASPQMNYIAAAAQSSSQSSSLNAGLNTTVSFLPMQPPPQPPHLSQQQQQQLQHFYLSHHYQNASQQQQPQQTQTTRSQLPGAVSSSPMPQHQYHNVTNQNQQQVPGGGNHSTQQQQQKQTCILNVGMMETQQHQHHSGAPPQNQQPSGEGNRSDMMGTVEGRPGENLCLQPLPTAGGKRHARRHSQ